MRYVSYFFAMILFVLTAVFGISLIRKQISHFNDKPAVVDQIKLSEYLKSGVKIRFKVTGPVSAEETHQELVYEIGQGIRAVKLLKGYNGSVEKEITLPNNYNAYETLATALHAAGFSNVNPDLKDVKYVGECPNGNIYTAEIIDSEGKTKSSLWKNSCSTKSGNLAANYSTILGLFKNQYPDYSKFSNSVLID